MVSRSGWEQTTDSFSKEGTMYSVYIFYLTVLDYKGIKFMHSVQYIDHVLYMCIYWGENLHKLKPIAKDQILIDWFNIISMGINGKLKIVGSKILTKFIQMINVAVHIGEQVMWSVNCSLKTIVFRAGIYMWCKIWTKSHKLGMKHKQRCKVQTMIHKVAKTDACIKHL